MKRHKPFRGMAQQTTNPLCHGRVTITLSAPQGAGKSLVVKILKAILPLTPVDEIVLVEDDRG